MELAFLYSIALLTSVSRHYRLRPFSIRDSVFRKFIIKLPTHPSPVPDSRFTKFNNVPSSPLTFLRQRECLRKHNIFARALGIALLVQAQPRIAAAVLALVAGAPVVARGQARERGGRLAGRRVRVAAPALARPLGAGVGEAAALAESHARLVGHAARVGHGAGQGAEGPIVGPALLGRAAEEPPPQRGHVREGGGRVARPRGRRGGGGAGDEGRAGGCGGLWGRDAVGGDDDQRDLDALAVDVDDWRWVLVPRRGEVG